MQPSALVPPTNYNVDRLVMARVPEQLKGDFKDRAASDDLKDMKERQILNRAVGILLERRAADVRRLQEVYQDLLDKPWAESDKHFQFWLPVVTHRRTKSFANRHDLKIREVVLLAVADYLYDN